MNALTEDTLGQHMPESHIGTDSANMTFRHVFTVLVLLSILERRFCCYLFLSLPLYVGVLYWVMGVDSSIAIILLRKGENWLFCFICDVAVCLLCLFPRSALRWSAVCDWCISL